MLSQSIINAKIFYLLLGIAIAIYTHMFIGHMQQYGRNNIVRSERVTKTRILGVDV